MPRRKAVDSAGSTAAPAMRVSSRKRVAARHEPEAPLHVSPVKRRRGRHTATAQTRQQAGARKESKSVYDVPSDNDADDGSDEQEHTEKKAPARPAAGAEDKDELGEEQDEDPGVQNGHGGSTTPRRNRMAMRVVGSAVMHSSGLKVTPGGRKEKHNAVTPTGPRRTADGETPQWRRNDRSARKKSARALIERVVAGNASEGDEEDDAIARQIFESSEDEDADELGEGEETHNAEAEANLTDTAVTPSKKAHGGPKKGASTRTRKKSPTPPRDLPAHELYFAQNRAGAAKTSSNTLASLQLLTHDEYFSTVHHHQDPHTEDIQFLQSWHAESFSQWLFELLEGFSICLYGYGSKRQLLHEFAKHMYKHTADRQASKILVINGYVRNSSIREILSTVTAAVDATYRLPVGNPSATLDHVRTLLSSHHVDITMVINSIDAAPLRKAGVQAILSQLAAHPRVRLICSADTPDFSLLWDSGLRSAFNFVFHDCTTFAPFTAEIDVVDEVHELLGRRTRRVGGKEGVTYVLRSLPENAKSLFRLLVSEVLVAIDDEGIMAGENPGIEYRILYNKAVEEFICSSEMAFRTLLKE